MGPSFLMLAIAFIWVLCSMKSLTIAIDFDDTFTADPVMWSAFIEQATTKHGHRVLCVTSRRDDEENREDIERCFSQFGISIPVIFSNMGSKLWTMEQRNVKVDIWIDDAPHALVHGK